MEKKKKKPRVCVARDEEKEKATYKVGRDPVGEESPLIWVRKPPHQHVEPDLVDKRLWDGPFQDATTTRLVVEQV